MEKSLESSTIDDLFKFGFKAIKDLENMDASDPNYDKTVTEALRRLEECTKVVSLAGLFSANEKVEEISTPVLKFLLLPAFLSALVTRKRDDRLHLIEQSEIYLKDFLTRCTEYSITNWTPPKETDNEEDDRSLENAARRRNAKIDRYKEEQKLEDLLLTIEKKVEDGSAQDDEVRDYYLNLIKYWCQKAVDDLDLAQQERKVLEFMRSRPKNAVVPKEAPPRKPFKPFIITKSEEQKKVYGAGYPSLPILSVAEFYEQKYGKEAKGEASGHCPGGHSLQKWAEDPEADQRAQEQEAGEKEDKVANDDPDELAHARAWDDWKDEHRRGEGNRHNMG